jgi:hypothetical protein
MEKRVDHDEATSCVTSRGVKLSSEYPLRISDNSFFSLLLKSATKSDLNKVHLHLGT